MSSNEEIVKYVVGCFGVMFITVLDMLDDVEKEPWPANSSSHPWSIVFIYWCAVKSGAFIINWDDRGTKNHIMQDA